MNATIIGTGSMARAIAARMLAVGNSVTLLSRTPDKATGTIEKLSAEAKKGSTVKVAPFGMPLTDPVVISAVLYSVAEEIIRKHGIQLSGKILVDGQALAVQFVGQIPIPLPAIQHFDQPHQLPFITLTDPDDLLMDLRRAPYDALNLVGEIAFCPRQKGDLGLG